MALSTPASDTSLAPALLRREIARGSSLWRDAWRRLLRNKLAVVGGVVVILLCLLAIFADLIAPQSYTKPNFGRLYEFPSREYPLGTDQLGRDVLSRLIYGARVSMLVGISVVGISSISGILIGAFAGYRGGWTDRIVSGFFFNVFLSFPGLLLAIAMVAFRGPSIINLIFALSVIGWLRSRVPRL